MCVALQMLHGSNTAETFSSPCQGLPLPSRRVQSGAAGHLRRAQKISSPCPWNDAAWCLSWPSAKFCKLQDELPIQIHSKGQLVGETDAAATEQPGVDVRGDLAQQVSIQAGYQSPQHRDAHQDLAVPSCLRCLIRNRSPNVLSQRSPMSIQQKSLASYTMATVRHI